MTAPATPRVDDWAARELGIVVEGDALAGLLAVGLRRNPRRVHLLVSTVLGKHLPTPPRVVLDAGTALGHAVRDVLGDGARDALVLGYAETATALGHTVAATLGAAYVHSTRRVVPGVPSVLGFEEEHSHASTHQLLLTRPELLDVDSVVLVDDELSTGRTALNTIAALQALRPRHRYVVAGLVDVRSAADRDAFAAAARTLGTAVEVVALGTGVVAVPEGTPGRAAELLAGLPVAEPQPDVLAAPGPVHVVPVDGGGPSSGRHGTTAAESGDLATRMTAAAAELSASIASARQADHGGVRVLVLGVEECMYAPLLLAAELARVHADVLFSTSTRSPVHVVDVPGYPVRSALRFTGGDADLGGPGERYAYNVPGWAAAGGDRHVVVVSDAPGDADAGLLDAVGRWVDAVHVVALPA